MKGLWDRVGGDGFEHAMSQMDHQMDLYDYMIGNVWNEQHIPYVVPARQPASCDFCGSEKVRWAHRDDKWVLLNAHNDLNHTCPKKGYEEPPF